MTSAPATKRFIVTDVETLKELQQHVDHLVKWSGMLAAVPDDPYKSGMFYLDVKIRAEWLHSKDAHDVYLKQAEGENKRGF